MENIEYTGFWAEKIADNVIRKAEQIKGEGCEIVCASGISPSGNIHLGNFREIVTTHIIAEELRRRGRKVRHIHSWDDYDRLRKVPSGVPADFAKYIGCPLSDIPAPDGSDQSYAEYFMASFRNSMNALGINPEYIRQSVKYKAGDYAAQVKHSIENRGAIFDILSKYQTLRDDSPEEIAQRREAYYPVSVYCQECGADETKTLAFEDGKLSYHCDKCEHEGSFDIKTNPSCKLVWKVDWPMRWAHEKVDFEPGGEDHSSPGSSYTVGKEMAKLFDWQAPYYTGYSFVGMAGRSKISSSAGGVPTVAQALDIFEPAVLRWLFVRRKPSDSFNIEFGQEMVRIYEEWDRLIEKERNGKASALDKKVLDIALMRDTEFELKPTVLPLPFRFLTSSADVTCGNVSQIIEAGHQSQLLAEGNVNESELYPRLQMAINWTLNYMPEDERTVIRDSFNGEYYASMPENVKDGVNRLVDELPENWSKDKLTRLVYGIPKTFLGFCYDEKPSPEISAEQRAFFIHLYQLTCNADTGPRLPTLFHSLGMTKMGYLLAGKELAE